MSSHALRVILLVERMLSLSRRRRFTYAEGVLDCIVSYNKFGAYCVPRSSRHRPAAQKILAHGVHEPETIKFMMENCGDGDVIHAGAYFGDFLPALSSSVSGKARIWAFEPNHENYRCAKITLDLNDIRNVQLMNAGLGAECGRSAIQTRDETGKPLGGASHIVQNPDIGRGLEEASIVSVDEIVPSDRSISIIQLDVEGYEQEALTGALDSIRRCLPILVLEVRPSSTLPASQWFSETILALGYRRTGDVHGNQVFQRPKGP